MAVREEVEKYIAKLTNEHKIDHAQNLFESGFLSSLDVLDLLSFIENTYNITVSDDDLEVENFGSIDNMVKYIEKAKKK